MGSAFTEQEIKIIREQLRSSAKECITKYGIKKTTVDQLAQMSNISKGAFYKFYDSKELLFFEVLEDFHNDFFGLALNILHERIDLSERERIEKAIWEGCKLIFSSPFMTHLKDEMPYLLRKLPESMLKNHYQSGHLSIQDIINASGITLSVPDKFVYTAIHALEVLITHTDDIGNPYFEEVVQLFIKSICAKII